MCIKGFRAVTYYNKNKYNKKKTKNCYRETKNKGRREKLKTTKNMVDLNPTQSIIIANVCGNDHLI